MASAFAWKEISQQVSEHINLGEPSDCPAKETFKNVFLASQVYKTIGNTL